MLKETKRRISVYCDDAINVQKYVKKASVDLIYLDPPFGTGDKQELYNYRYDDLLTGNEYISFLQVRLEKIVKCMSREGLICIHLDRRYSFEATALMTNKLGFNLSGDLIWAYRRWSSSKKSLQETHDHILVFSKNSHHNIGRQILGVPIVAPSSHERVGYPTQKPVHLLVRLIQIIRTQTKVECVLDPFMGSGTTLMAARLLKIACIGIDVSPSAVSLVEERIFNEPHLQHVLRRVMSRMVEVV